jgi:SH3-like domain-containing protein
MRLILSVILVILLWLPKSTSALCVQGDCANGHGTFVLSDGRKYVGEFQEGVRTGRGMMTYPDGAKYVGDWQNDEPNGKGTLILVDKFEYTGEFANGARHGEGTFETADGKKYVGQWQNDVPHGQGRIIDPGREEFVGQFENGRRNGPGEATYSDGTRYKGQWADDLPNGQGVKILPDGMQYSGEFKNGLMFGKGTVVMPDGSQIKIQWQSDVLEQQEETRPEDAFSTAKENGNWYMIPTPGETQGLYSREPLKPAVHVAASSQELPPAMETTPSLVMATPLESAVQIPLSSSEQEKVAVEVQTQPEPVKEIGTAAAEKSAAETMEASPGQEPIAPVETAAQVSLQSPVKKKIASGAQTQPEPVKEIGTAAAEKAASETVEASPGQEPIAPVETAAQVSLQSSVKKKIASGAQTQPEPVKEIGTAAAEKSATETMEASPGQDQMASVETAAQVSLQSPAEEKVEAEVQAQKEAVEEIETAETVEAAAGPQGLSAQTSETPRIQNYASIIQVAKGANIRSEASLSSEVLRAVPPGYPLAVLERQGEWVQVEDFRQRRGWVHVSLLTELETVIIKVWKGNLRRGPSANDEIIVQLDHGTVMSVIEKRGDWLEVSDSKDLIGWLYRKVTWP